MRPTDQLLPPLLPPEPGGHLPVALLRQYVAGTLAPAAQYRVEAHTLDCPRCAEVLEGLEMTDAATTNNSLIDLQNRLRTRVAQEADRQPVADWPWLQMAGVVLLLIISLIEWRFYQEKTEAQSEAVATVRRAERAASQARREAVAPAAPEMEATELKSKSAATVTAADAPVPAAKAARPAPSLVTISARSKSKPATRSTRVADPANGELATIKPETVRSRVLADSAANPAVAAAISQASALTSAPLPPDPARTGTVTTRSSAPTVEKQTAKMPPSEQTPMDDDTANADLTLVQGRVTDQASGQGLPGVTVLVKGTDQGVSTQADGSFALPVTKSPSTLTIASIGYQTKEIKLTNPAAPLTLALTPATESLSEVVVVRKGKMPGPLPVAPTPTGGYPAFHEYIKQELEYPEKALQNRTKGTVKLKFTVTATGAIEELKVVSGLSKECDAEALRLVREGPAWFPGILNGRRTAQQVRIAVPFRLP